MFSTSMSSDDAGQNAERPPSSTPKSTHRASQNEGKTRTTSRKRMRGVDEELADDNDENSNVMPDEQRRRQRRRQVGDTVVDLVEEEIEANLSPLRKDMLASANDLKILTRTFERHEHDLSVMQETIGTKASAADMGRIHLQQTTHEADITTHKADIAAIQTNLSQCATLEQMNESLATELKAREERFEKVKAETRSFNENSYKKFLWDFSKYKIHPLVSRIDNVDNELKATKEYFDSRIGAVETKQKDKLESVTTQLNTSIEKIGSLEDFLKIVEDARKRQNVDDSKRSMERDDRLDQLYRNVKNLEKCQKKAEDDRKEDQRLIQDLNQKLEDERLSSRKNTTHLERQIQDLNDERRKETAELNKTIQHLIQRHTSEKADMTNRLSILKSDVEASFDGKHLGLITEILTLIENSKKEAKADIKGCRDDYDHFKSGIKHDMDVLSKRYDEIQAACKPVPLDESPAQLEVKVRLDSLIQSWSSLQKTVNQLRDILAPLQNDVEVLEEQQRNHFETCEARQHEYLELGKDYTNKTARDLRLDNSSQNIALWARLRHMYDRATLERAWSPDSVVGEVVSTSADQVALATPVSDAVDTDLVHNDEGSDEVTMSRFKHIETVLRSDIEGLVTSNVGLETQLNELKKFVTDRQRTTDERINGLKIRVDNVYYDPTRSSGAM
ncbi:hypothetical protein E8E13_009306 [Curvularia kusanoi]|uniref:Uncharacterized protein n=1 Tax=Curvularia kusanoi TaxID=90978 RepID=A0A9P4TN13_CURKU|nr:hypothetical protein E8E13_009306 [Curvularia kusanoi]